MGRNRYYQGAVSDHFDGALFHGPGKAADKSRGDLFRLMVRTQFAAWPRWVANPSAPPPPARIEGAELRVTTIGHASHLIQTRGLNILVDPVWSARASPSQMAGPKRVRAPGVAMDALPSIDVILLTHNHYDHLDLSTLAALHARRPCRIVAPLGNDTILKRHDATFRVETHDWGARVPLSDDIAVNIVPCHHWSARSLGDRRMALWAAFLIETPDGPIYHIGDTAYRDGAIFRDIPRAFGRPRLAIIPIGAYAPRWFMRDQHVDPSESVAIFEDCQAHFALAHHWGTFRLTAEAIDEPPRRLAQALTDRGISLDRFWVRLPGEFFDVPLIS
jgi:L-ascorbate metabolism protein UlaG (beta-lactamase superfamily)